MTKRRSRTRCAPAARAAARAALAVAAFGAALRACSRGRWPHVEQQVARRGAGAAAVLAAQPRCFGAAARDPRRPVRNPGSPPSSRRRSRPSEANVPATTSSGAARSASASSAWPPRGEADLRARRRQPRGPLARGLEVVAHAALARDDHHPHGLPVLAGDQGPARPARSRCIAWNREKPQGSRRHPEVDTLFVSNITGGNWTVTAWQDDDPRQKDRRATSGPGVRCRRRSRRIVRHPRHAESPTGDDARVASTRAIAVRRGRRGCRARSRAPARAGSRTRRHSRPAGQCRCERAQVVDMTRYLCGPRRCRPVIGGVLVYKDRSHMTTVFARSLWPYLNRRVERLLRG